MWGLSTELPRCERLKAQTLKHYEEATSAIDQTLEQYISKHNLVLVMLAVYFTLKCVVPWIRKNIWGMSIATLLIKLLLALPLTKPIMKKLLKKGYLKIYDGLDKMLYGDKREEIHESLPQAPIKPAKLRERIEVSNLNIFKICLLDYF